MVRHKDFGSGNADVEPLTFDLHGETFVCLPQVPGKFLLDLAKNSASEDAGENAEIITKFFSQVLEDESFERFDALLEDKRRVVTMETLGEIVSWLMEEYSGRPEKQPEASSTGR